MLRALCLAFTLFFVPLGHASADGPTNPDANAALKYWQAFATLPRLTAAEQDRLQAETLTMPLDTPTRDLLTRAAYALRMLHRAAKLPRCHWGIGWPDEGIENRLPHLEAARTLSSLACLSARVHFEEGRSAEAVADIVASLTLGRHVSTDGSLVAILVDYAIERRASEMLARYLPKLDAATLRQLKTQLEALPRCGSLAYGVREEQALETGWLVRKLKEFKDVGSLSAFLIQLCDSPEKGRALLVECGGTGAGVVKCAEETVQSYDRMAKMMDLPLDQFEKEQDREAVKHAANPVFKLLTPAIIRCRWFQAQADIRRALLSAAIAVQLDGPRALKNHADPVAGGPFEYDAFDGGFALRSTWKPDAKLRAKRGLDDKPLMLTVGRRGK